MLRAKRRRTRMHDKKGNPIFNTMNSTPLQSRYKNQNTHLKQLTECQCKVCQDGGCNGNCSFCGCSNCKPYNDNPDSRKCCRGAPQRNPALGYRRQLVFNNIIRDKNNPYLRCMEEDGEKVVTITTNNVYKDNYARICGSFRKGLEIDNSGNTVIEQANYDENGKFIPQKWENANREKTCGYRQTKPHIQNRNGWMNDKYNYSTKQYLARRCRTFEDLAFNFLSNKAITDSSGSEFLTGCLNSNIDLTDGTASRDCKCYKNNCTCYDISCNNIVGIDCSYNSICSQTTPDCAKKGYTICEATSNNCKAVYKRSNPRFSTQGAVSGGSRINRLKYQTQLKAQSIIKPTKANAEAASWSTGANKREVYQGTPYTNVNTTRGVNSINGTYPATLYRNTYPTYKSNLSGLCLGNMGLTLNSKPQRCKVPMVVTPTCKAVAACRMMQTLPESCKYPCNKPCGIRKKKN